MFSRLTSRKLMFRRLLLCCCLFLSAVSYANDDSLPKQYTLDGQSLKLNGAGVRSKFFLSLYSAGLYLNEKNQDANAVIHAEQPMNLRLLILSNLITAKKMEEATREGFTKATAGNTAAIDKEIETFLAVFRQGVAEGDVFDLSYLPDQGTRISKNNQLQATIKGQAFKQALLGIWLGKNPVQKKLKTALLGE